MSEHHFTAGEAGLWVQPDGANTVPLYLGCHEMGDIQVPEGGFDIITCPDPNRTNAFKTVGSIKQQADPPSTSINGDVVDALDELELIRGQAFNLYILKMKKGRRDQFTNWDRMFVLRAARKTETSYAALAAKAADNNDRSTYEVSVSAEEFILPFRLSFARQTITEANALNSIVFCNEEQERTNDTPALESCQTGFIGCDAASSATANVLKTVNGATWTATSADPFAVDEHILAVRCTEVSRDVTRVYAFRGVTDADDPAELAYSDDSGATWVLVNIGAVDGEFINSPNAVHVQDLNNMWVVTTEGYIYKSEDAGLTWTAQESGVVTTDPLRAVHFADVNVGIAGGDGNTLMYTVDSGDTWSQVAMPGDKDSDNITAVYVLDSQRWWVGYSDGDLYYTVDQGDNWSSRSFTGSGAGAVKSVKFINELQGFLVHNTAAPVGYVHQTYNGGYSWERISLPTNTGINDLAICNDRKVFVVGEAQGGTGFVGKGIAS